MINIHSTKAFGITNTSKIERKGHKRAVSPFCEKFFGKRMIHLKAESRKRALEGVSSLLSKFSFRQP